MTTKTTYGTVELKVRSIAERTLPSMAYLFADYSQANVALDKIDRPTVLYLLPPSGALGVRRDIIRDKPQTQIWFLCPSDFDFDGNDNDCRIEAMKRAALRFLAGVNDSGLFEPIEGDVPYQVAYDTFDDNLTGICINPVLEEIDGVPLCTLARDGWDYKGQS